MDATSGGGAAVVLVHGMVGDFLVAGDSPLHAEIRQAGGQARAGLAMLAARLGAGDTVIDLGAGVGMLAVPLQQAVGIDGRVWCFEPDPDTFALLRCNLALNGIGLLARAVPGNSWPRLDAWCLEEGITAVEAIRVDGPEAAAALARDGRKTLEAHRPAILFTGDFAADEAGKPVREINALGYSFFSPAAGTRPGGGGAPAAVRVAGPAEGGGGGVLAAPDEYGLGGGRGE